jgi:Domain of unknown function (DUF4349)
MTTEQALLELRSLPGAPDTLRERVRALPDPHPRTWGLPRLEVRRMLLVAAPAVLAVAVGAAALNGVLAGGGDRSVSAGAGTTTALTFAERAKAPPDRDAQPFSPSVTATRASGAQALALPPSTTRLNRYQAWLRIEVDRDRIGKAATRAMEIARGYGGYVASVDMNTPTSRGRALLILKIPVAKVGDATRRLNAVGDVKAQRIRIDDLQRQANAQEKAIIRLTARIESIEAALRGTVSDAERARLLFQLEDAKRRLAAVTRAHQETLRAGRLATVAVTYFAPGAAAAKPDEPGRLERTVREAGDFLVRELSWLLYAVIVAGPIALLALAIVLGARAARRGSDRRLLERA